MINALALLRTRNEWHFMKIDFDGIQAFVRVAELGGFNKAADQLHLTQTALTRRIQKLEAYLGVRLLDRTTRSVELTVVGREFLPQAQRLVAEMTLAFSRLKDVSRHAIGNVTLASIPTMAASILPVVIRKYVDRYPGNRIRVMDGTATEVREAVLHGVAEFGISIQMVARPELLEVPILKEPFMLFCCDAHPLSQHKSVAWSDLRSTELIMIGGQSANRVLIDYQLTRKRIALDSHYEVQHLSTALGLVASGVGVAILPFSTMGKEAAPGVCRIPLVGPVISRTLALTRRAGSTLSPAAQAFYEMLHAELVASVKTKPRARS
jgi:DNA-binding transcriptional LysR family regulator